MSLIRHRALARSRRHSLGRADLKLIYLAPADIQIARVDRQAIVYFCSALARQNVNVELIALHIKPLRSEPQHGGDPLSLYRIPNRFAAEMVRTPLRQTSPSWLVGVVRLAAHVRAVSKRVKRDRSQSRTIVYTKNYAPALALIMMRRVGYRLCVAFEAHVPPTGSLRRFVLRNSDCVIANSYALAAELLASHGLRPAKVLGTHQGVDLEPFEEPFDRRAYRVSLGLPANRQIVAYTGKIFHGYREVEAILEAAQHPSLQDVLFVLVGGREDHVELLRSDVHARGPANVLFTGFVPPREVHRYQRAADALLLYYPSGMGLNAYRSPGKLFEYMASGVPIVAVDLPVLREVLGDPPAALMVGADSPLELTKGILRILSEPDEALELATQARERVKQFTWDRRADEVLRFLLERSGG